MSNTYLTEAALCEKIWANVDSLLNADYLTDVTYYRETELAYRLRPDFMVFGRNSGAPSISIYEVKITADAYSVHQLCNYMWVAKRHALEWARGLKDAYIPLVEGILLARYIDKTVYSLAEESGICVQRISVDNDLSVSLDHEEHPNSDSPYDQSLLRSMTSHWMTSEVLHGSH